MHHQHAKPIMTTLHLHLHSNNQSQLAPVGDGTYLAILTVTKDSSSLKRWTRKWPTWRGIERRVTEARSEGDWVFVKVGEVREGNLFEDRLRTLKDDISTKKDKPYAVLMRDQLLQRPNDHALIVMHPIDGFSKEGQLACWLVKQGLTPDNMERRGRSKPWLKIGNVTHGC